MNLESKINLYIYLAILIVFLTIICIAIQIIVIKKMIKFDRNVLVTDKEAEEDNINPIGTKANPTSPYVHMGEELKTIQDLSDNSNKLDINNLNPAMTNPSHTKNIIVESTQMQKHEIQLDDQSKNQASTEVQAHETRLDKQSKNQESIEVQAYETQLDEQIKNQESIEVQAYETQLDEQIKDEESTEVQAHETQLDEHIKDKVAIEMPAHEIQLDEHIKDKESIEMQTHETQLDEQIKDEESTEMPKQEIQLDDQSKDKESTEMPKQEIQLDEHIKDKVAVEMPEQEIQLDEHIKDKIAIEIPKQEIQLDEHIKDKVAIEMPKQEIQLDDSIPKTLNNVQENSHIDADFHEYSHLIITPIELNMDHQNKKTTLISTQEDVSPSTKESMLKNNGSVDISLNESEKTGDAPYEFSDNYANFQQNIKLDEKSNIDLDVKELGFKKILDTYQKMVDMYK